MDEALPGVMTRRANPLLALLKGMRPKQWAKNGLLFIGILFTLDRGHGLDDWLRVLAGVALFCLLSGAVYLINDLVDLEADRQHPEKRRRPIASGALPVPLAIGATVFFVLFSLGASFALGWLFGAVALAYFAITLGYSFSLKNIVIVDVMTLASGFVLRAVAGAVLIGVEISVWLLLCTSLGALFIGVAKRRGELVLMEGSGKATRRILEEYNLALLDQMTTILASAIIVCYALYTFYSATGQRHPMMITIPFVIYGVFRYLYLVYKRGEGGSPENTLFSDRPLLLCVFLWLATCALIILLTQVDVRQFLKTASASGWLQQPAATTRR
jgi:4-hydroxybenzoate polyprenyltransferase